jgi:hypothetical protein
VSEDRGRTGHEHGQGGGGQGSAGGHGRGPHGTIPPEGWMDRPESVKTFFRVFYAVCALLFLAEVLLLGAENPHPTPLEERMRFFVYPVYGFVSFWFLVLVARAMRTVLIRSEDYYEGGGAYEEDDDTRADVSGEGAHG